MKQILLISEDKVKTVSNLDNNVFGKWLLPAIREAQDIGLQHIIGSCLYNHILNLVDTGEITLPDNELYKDLLDNQICDYLVYQSLVNVIPLINVNMANMGTVVSNDEHIQTLSQGNIDLVRGYYQSLADVYQKRLQDYLKCNCESFPELNECGCGSCAVKPNLTSNANTSGIWLGGLRNPNRKTAKDGCCCSSKSSSKADCQEEYERGYRMGIAYQKSLLSSTAITENGTYTNDNGWNEIDIDVPDNYNEGYADGEEHQKSLLVSTAITANGTYTRANGYSAVTVDVPETILERLNEGFMTNGERVYEAEEGKAWNRVKISVDVPDRYDDGVNDQKRKLISTAITENGTYTRADGYSAVTVNVAQTGYTQQDLDDAYNSGYTSGNTDGFASGHTSGVTDGINQQKALLSSTTITENGTYTRENGWSAVTVNVPTDIGYHVLTIDFSRSEKPSGLEGKAVITVSSKQSGSESKTYSGSDVVFYLLPGVDYEITYGDVSGYTTPSSNSISTYWGHSTTLYPTYVEKPTLAVSPTQINADYSGQTRTISVTSNSNWTITDYPSWMTLSALSGSGDGSFTVTINENTGSIRTGNIVLVAGDVTVTITVTQYGSDSLNKPLTITPSTSGVTVVWEADSTAFTKTIEYCKNGGEWVAITSSTGNSAPSILLISGDVVWFRGDNAQYSSSQTRGNHLRVTEGKYNLYGNIMSLVDSDGFNTATTLSSAYTFTRMFDAHTTNRLASIDGLVLPATTLTPYCYQEMFRTDYGLQDGSVLTLPATTLAEGCYRDMFFGCNRMSSAPALPATTLAPYCYYGMFHGTILNQAPVLPVTTLANYCYANMFRSTYLTASPTLPATTLVEGCYSGMFNGTSNLRNVICLATNISAINCTANWLSGVASTGTFTKAASMSDWTTGESGIPEGWTVQNNS